MQRAMIEFGDQLSKNSKNSEATNVSKEYLNANIIKPSSGNTCKQEIDHKDKQLMDRDITNKNNETLAKPFLMRHLF